MDELIMVIKKTGKKEEKLTKEKKKKKKKKKNEEKKKNEKKSKHSENAQHCFWKHAKLVKIYYLSTQSAFWECK